jgi:hypothetical protein
MQSHWRLFGPILAAFANPARRQAAAIRITISSSGPTTTRQKPDSSRSSAA